VFFSNAHSSNIRFAIYLMMEKSWIARKRIILLQRIHSRFAYWTWLWFRVHKNIEQLKDVEYTCKIVVGSQVFLLLMDFPCVFHLSDWSIIYQDVLGSVDNLFIGIKLLIWLY
jgi:hypothetical protein